MIPQPWFNCGQTILSRTKHIAFWYRSRAEFNLLAAVWRFIASCNMQSAWANYNHDVFSFLNHNFLSHPKMAERKTTINDTAIIKTNAHAMIAGLILCFWFDGQPLKNHASLAWETRGKQLPPGGRWRFRLHMRIGCHHPWRAPRAARCFNKRRPYVVTLRWWLSLTLSLQELPNGDVSHKTWDLTSKNWKSSIFKSRNWKMVTIVFGNWEWYSETGARKLGVAVGNWKVIFRCIRRLRVVFGN